MRPRLPVLARAARTADHHVVGALPVVHFSVHEARAHCVAADVVSTELQRRVPHQAEYAVLSCYVMAETCTCFEAINGGREHNGAAAVGDHRRNYRLDAAPDSGEVHVDHVLPLVVGQLPERAKRPDARVGYQDVDLAEVTNRSFDCSVQRGAIPHVTFQADDAPAKLLDLCHGAGQIVRCGQLIGHGRDGLTDVCGNDVGACCCQRESVRASLAASSTGDQRYSTGDVGHTLPTSCVKS